MTDACVVENYEDVVLTKSWKMPDKDRHGNAILWSDASHGAMGDPNNAGRFRIERLSFQNVEDDPFEDDATIWWFFTIRDTFFYSGRREGPEHQEFDMEQFMAVNCEKCMLHFAMRGVECDTCCETETCKRAKVKTSCVALREATIKATDKDLTRQLSRNPPIHMNTPHTEGERRISRRRREKSDGKMPERFDSWWKELSFEETQFMTEVVMKQWHDMRTWTNLDEHDIGTHIDNDLRSWRLEDWRTIFRREAPPRVDSSVLEDSETNDDFEEVYEVHAAC